MLKIDFESQILALFDVYFCPFNKSHEKINIIFVISAMIASIWNVFYQIPLTWWKTYPGGLGTGFFSINTSNLSLTWSFTLGFFRQMKHFTYFCFSQLHYTLQIFPLFNIQLFDQFSFPLYFHSTLGIRSFK